MKKDYQLEDKIDKYISGHLDQNEKLAFERLLSEDKALSSRVENEMLIKRNIKRYHRTKVKEQLKVIHEKTVNRKSNIKYLIPFALAASVSMFAFFYLTLEEEVNSQELYAQYYKKYEINAMNRGDAKDALGDIFEYYNQDSFDVVIKDTDEYILSTLSASKRLVIGISYLETNDLERAKTIFQSIIAEQDVVFNDQALWYKALAELKSNDIDKVKNLMRRLLKDRSSDHFDDAKKLMDSLNKL